MLVKQEHYEGNNGIAAADESDAEKSSSLQVSFKTSNLKNLGRYVAEKTSSRQLSNRLRSSAVDSIATPSKASWVGAEQQKFLTEDKSLQASRAGRAGAADDQSSSPDPPENPKRRPRVRPTVLSGAQIDFSAAMRAGDSASLK